MNCLPRVGIHRLHLGCSSVYLAPACGLPLQFRRGLRRINHKRALIPYHDPRDFTRDRDSKPSKSLYHNPEEWMEEPVYPEVEPDPSTMEGVKFRRRKEGEKIAALSTVDEKINHFRYMPIPLTVKKARRLWDRSQRFWEPFFVEGFSSSYNNTPTSQYLTKTSIIDELPASYYSLDDAMVKEFVTQIKPFVEEALMLEKRYHFRNEEVIRKKHGDMIKPAQNIIDAVLRALDLVASHEFPHLKELQVDSAANIRALWRRSGYLEQDIKEEAYLADGGEAIFQYRSAYPVYRLFRHEDPLPKVVPREPVESTDVPLANYTPTLLGLKTDKFIPEWLPGFRFGDPREFSTLSFSVPENWDDVVDNIGEENAFDNLSADCILNSFARVVGQAAYLGFSILNELTYPIVTQSITTTGKYWIFSLYQANTISVWRQDSDNPYQNLCWMTKPMPLFEAVTKEGVVGMNDDVIAHLVRQYFKAPERRPDANLRPFLPDTDRSYWKTEESGVPFYSRNPKPRHPVTPEI